MKRFIDSEDPRIPVIGLEDEYPPGYIDVTHSHGRAQLLYASSGVMSVIVQTASFVIPPQRAVWIPRGMAHEVSCRGNVSLRTLYFDASVHDLGEGTCRVIEVSDFLKALILEVAHFGSQYDMDGREGQIVRLLVDEIEAMPSAPYHAPMPRDPRLLRVCRTILEDPADQRDLDDWASLAGMGRRTFTRLFKQETGMGVAVWRQQVRLMEEGVLVADRGNGFLVTHRDYRDFQLRAEFFVDTHTNSGIFIRCTDPATVNSANAYEVNIWDERPEPRYGTGAIVDLAAVDPMPKAGGRWNSFEITAAGDAFTVVFNGQKTADAVRSSRFATGRIALQHGPGVPGPGGAVNDRGVVRFRKVEIRVG